MGKIEIKIESLRRLLEECLNNDARCRAELAAISKLGANTRGKVVSFNALVGQTLAEARRLSQPRYQDLMDAIAHDPEAVPDALDKFVGVAGEFPAKERQGSLQT